MKEKQFIRQSYEGDSLPQSHSTREDRVVTVSCLDQGAASLTKTA